CDGNAVGFFKFRHIRLPVEAKARDRQQAQQPTKQTFHGLENTLHLPPDGADSTRGLIWLINRDLTQHDNIRIKIYLDVPLSLIICNNEFNRWKTDEAEY